MVIGSLRISLQQCLAVIITALSAFIILRLACVL